MSKTKMMNTIRCCVFQFFFPNKQVDQIYDSAKPLVVSVSSFIDAASVFFFLPTGIHFLPRIRNAVLVSRSEQKIGLACS